MNFSLIEYCEKALKEDPTSQNRKYIVGKLEASMEAYIEITRGLEKELKIYNAKARELSVFIEMLKKEVTEGA